MSIELKENLNYKIKIDVPNTIELISETFDNVLNHMPPKMLVFGGALRDLIAGFGLHHDLDIIGSLSEEEEFVHYLETSSKWMEERVIVQYKRQAEAMKKNPLGVTSPHCMEGGMLDLNRTFSGNIKSRSSNYGNIQNVRTFISSSGHKLQIITNKYNLLTLKETPSINIAKTVDFICCGLIMDTDGNVYEIIEGAKDDCTKRILRINKNADVKFHNLTKRIEKLTARGWKSEINLAKFKRKQIRLEKTAKKRTERLEKQQNKLSMGYIQIYRCRNNKVQVVIDASKMRIFNYCKNSAAKVLEAFSTLFIDHYLSKSHTISTSYTNNNHFIVNIFVGNMSTALKLKNTLLYLEHRNLPIQKRRTDQNQKYNGDAVFQEVFHKMTYNIDGTVTNSSTSTPATTISSADFEFVPRIKLSKPVKLKKEYGSFENTGEGIEVAMPETEESFGGLIKQKKLKKKLPKDLFVTEDQIDEFCSKQFIPKNSDAESSDLVEFASLPYEARPHIQRNDETKVEGHSGLKTTKKEKAESSMIKHLENFDPVTINKEVLGRLAATTATKEERGKMLECLTK